MIRRKMRSIEHILYRWCNEFVILIDNLYSKLLYIIQIHIDFE